MPKVKVSYSVQYLIDAKRKLWMRDSFNHAPYKTLGEARVGARRLKAAQLNVTPVRIVKCTAEEIERL